jgi:hypothetical protein
MARVAVHLIQYLYVVGMAIACESALQAREWEVDQRLEVVGNRRPGRGATPTAGDLRN